MRTAKGRRISTVHAHTEVKMYTFAVVHFFLVNDVLCPTGHEIFADVVPIISQIGTNMYRSVHQPVQIWIIANTVQCKLPHFTYIRSVRYGNRHGHHIC